MKIVVGVCAVVSTVALVVAVGLFAMGQRADADRQSDSRTARIERCVSEAMAVTTNTYASNGQPIRDRYQPSETKVRAHCEATVG